MKSNLVFLTAAPEIVWQIINKPRQGDEETLSAARTLAQRPYRVTKGTTKRKSRALPRDRFRLKVVSSLFLAVARILNS